MSKLNAPSIEAFFSVRLSEPEKVTKADTLPRRHTGKAIAAAIQAAGLGDAFAVNEERGDARAAYLNQGVGLYHFGVSEIRKGSRIVGYQACDEYQNFVVTKGEGHYTLAEAVAALKDLVASETRSRHEQIEEDEREAV